MASVAVRQLMGFGPDHIARMINRTIDDIEFRVHGRVLHVDHTYFTDNIGMIHWSVLITYQLPVGEIEGRIAPADVPVAVDITEGDTR